MTPFHGPRLERAEALLRELGVDRVAYLLIPDYHGSNSADTAAFRAWCGRDRPFEVEWLLHGYYHREMQAHDGERLGPWAWLQRRYATAGEGEFATLGEEQAMRRVRDGITAFEHVIGRRPDGFVPPAWLYNDSLPRVLRAEGFRFWEDRRFVYDLTSDDGARAPVVTWATRTPLLKWSSVAGTPLLERVWRRAPLLRLAIHPYDFDHSATVESIRHVWRRALARRRQMSYHGLLNED